MFIVHIQFSDPYDAYLYQSYHITTPVVTPTLLFPTDTQPSYISTRHTAEQLFRSAAVSKLYSLFIQTFSDYNQIQSLPRSHVSCHVMDHDRKTLMMRMFSPGAPLMGAMSSPANTGPSPRARDQVLKVSTKLALLLLDL